jgi:hypothetical protein
VHSRYVRQPADLPVGGRPVSILQFQDLIGRRRRRTSPLLENMSVGAATA